MPKQNKPPYVGFHADMPGLYQMNRSILLKSSKKTQYLMKLVLVVAGSSHVGKPGFVKALNDQFWPVLQGKQRLHIFPGPICCKSGGGIDDSDLFIRFAWNIAHEPGYEGQVFVLVLGTNDASNPQLNQEVYAEKYRQLCKNLLKVPKLILLPTSLLPRQHNPNRPKKNANMLITSNTIKQVCHDLRSLEEFTDRIKFINIHKDISEIGEDEETGELVSIPLDGMLKADLVHLSPQAEPLVAKSILMSVNLLYNACFQPKSNTQ